MPTKSSKEANELVAQAKQLNAAWRVGECDDLIETAMQGTELLDQLREIDGHEAVCAELQKMLDEVGAALEAEETARSKKTSAKSGKKKASRKAVAEGRRIVEEWTHDEYDNAADALAETVAALDALDGSNETELVAALEKVLDEATAIVEEAGA